MTKKTIFFATSLFLGGFIPLKDTVSENSTISYAIYADVNKKNVYLQCNAIKNKMLEIFDEIKDYSFSKTDENLVASIDMFLDIAVNAVYEDYILSLYLDSNGSCCMKGILLSFDVETHVEKTYFFEELFQ
ncbi:unknown [Firmicutes bacterium CAG:631]|nr:unknown [Firmicutes bacterium CAG:631]